MKILNENYKLLEQYKNDNTLGHQRNLSCSSMQDSQNYFNRNYKIMNNDEDFTQSMKTINSLWNQLGVLEDYRIVFNVVLNQLDEGNKTDFVNNEIESLKNISSLLTVIIVMYLYLC